MPDLIAVLSVALDHVEHGPLTLTYETGQIDLVGGPLDGDDLRTARCAALPEYRRFADREPHASARGPVPGARKPSAR